MNAPVVLILGGLVHYQMSKEVRAPGVVTWIHEHGAADLTLFMRGGVLHYRDRAPQGEPGEVGTWHTPQIPHVTVTETKLAGEESGEEKETPAKKKK